MNKSLLSVDKIQVDLKRILNLQFKHNWGIILHNFSALGGALLTFVIVSQASQMWYWITFSIFIAMLVWWCLSTLFKIISYVSLNSQIEKGNFSVTTEKLINVDVEAEYTPITHISKMSKSDYRGVCVLKFLVGTWFIPESLYEWSGENTMSYADIRDTSEVGDEFYVVTYNKSKKIGCAYNKKFFHLAEHPKHEEKNEEEFSSLNSAELERDVIEDKIKLDESKIKVDLKRHSDYVRGVLEHYCAFAILMFFVIGILIAIPTQNAWMLLILPAAPIVCQLCIFAVWIMRRHNIKKGRFSIHTGVFERNQTREIFFWLDRGRWNAVEDCLDHYYFLVFDLGKWWVPEKELYAWSNKSIMDIKALRLSTEKGDEFYIVTYGKGKKIGYVYNKKLFELDEHLIHDEKPE